MSYPERTTSNEYTFLLKPVIRYMSFDEKKRVAIFATHPIQYQTPWFAALSKVDGLFAQVYYGMVPSSEQQGIGFDVPFEWDIPMLDGYEWKVLENRSKRPGLGHFFGIRVNGLARRLRHDNIKIAILTGWQSYFLIQVLVACRRLGIPILVRGDSNALHQRKMWKKQLHRVLFSKFDGFLTVGEANAALYRDSGVPDSKLHHCPHFVDNERIFNQFCQHIQNREQLRQQYGIPKNNICFVFVGKLIDKKKPMDLLRAISAATQKQNTIHLLIVGSGELMQKLMEEVEQKSLPVSFAGFLNQTAITKAFAAADCLVLPSDFGETWGLVVNEAMACGLPALVSDRVGCSPDLVNENQTGGIFRFGDIDDIAMRMLEVSHERERWREMGEAARRLVFNHYSVDQAVRGTLSALQATMH